MPFLPYADWDAPLTPYDENRDESPVYSPLVPCSIGSKQVTDGPIPGDEPYQSHTGEDDVNWFMREMLVLDVRCMDYLFVYHQMVRILNDARNFSWALEC